MIKVYSHPRSGSNYLMALLARNFWPAVDLSRRNVKIGHWSKRIPQPVNPYGQLFGHHGFPRRGYVVDEALYVYRDGRAAIASLWLTPQFWRGDSKMPLSNFLRQKLDWQGSPGFRDNPGLNVVQHWVKHLEEWRAAGVYAVRYEELVQDAEAVLPGVARRFGLREPEQYAGVDEPVGWFPTGNRVDGWKELWTDDDLDFFWSLVPADFHGIWQ